MTLFHLSCLLEDMNCSNSWPNPHCFLGHGMTGSRVNIHGIRKPYLLLIGDEENPRNAKTAFGLRDWVSEACIGQLRFNKKAVDLKLPDISPAEAVRAGA